MRLRPSLRPACRQEYVGYFADAGSLTFAVLRQNSLNATPRSTSCRSARLRTGNAPMGSSEGVRRAARRLGARGRFEVRRLTTTLNRWTGTRWPADGPLRGESGRHFKRKRSDGPGEDINC
jgi:hypothetical protein